MLVLARKPKEKVYFDLPSGEQIEVVIIKVHGRNVHLGITAPKPIPVYRDNCKNRR